MKRGFFFLFAGVTFLMTAGAGAQDVAPFQDLHDFRVWLAGQAEAGSDITVSIHAGFESSEGYARHEDLRAEVERAVVSQIELTREGGQAWVVFVGGQSEGVGSVASAVSSAQERASNKPRVRIFHVVSPADVKGRMRALVGASAIAAAPPVEHEGHPATKLAGFLGSLDNVKVVNAHVWGGGEFLAQSMLSLSWSLDGYAAERVGLWIHGGFEAARPASPVTAQESLVLAFNQYPALLENGLSVSVDWQRSSSQRYQSAIDGPAPAMTLKTFLDSSAGRGLVSTSAHAEVEALRMTTSFGPLNDIIARDAQIAATAQQARLLRLTPIAIEDLVRLSLHEGMRGSNLSGIETRSLLELAERLKITPRERFGADVRPRR